MKRQSRFLALVLALVLSVGLLSTVALANGEPQITLIAYGYTYVGDFHEGLAAVQTVRNDKINNFFIDKIGSVVIVLKDEYTMSGDFYDGLAAVLDNNGKWGFIDRTGKEIIPCKFFKPFLHESRLGPAFIEGLAAVCDENFKFGFIDKTGNVIIPFKYTYAGDFSEGLAAVSNDDGKWGFIDKTGKEVISCKYYNPTSPSFSEGLAAVCDEKGDWSFIDKTGRKAISNNYSYVGSFSEGLAAVYDKNNKCGFIDNTGKEVIPCKYYNQTPPFFSEGLAAVCDENNKFGFIDKSGNIIIPFKYYYEEGAGEATWCTPLFSEGIVALCDENNKCGCIDKTGKTVIPFEHGPDTMYKRFSEGMFAAEIDNKWGFLTLTEQPSTPSIPATGTAYPSNLTVEMDGKKVEFQAYKLLDANGNPTNYVKVRDLALALNGTKAQFSVGWDGRANLIAGDAYTPDGSENKTPFSGERPYSLPTNATNVNGAASDLVAFMLFDDNGGGYTYYQLRDLGRKLGFNVGWNTERGISYIETDKPYDPNN